MRNLRKLTAVVIAIALVLTSMTAVFAADTTATTVVNGDKAVTLKDLGLYAGTNPDDPKDGLDGALTTQDSLIFLAKLFGYNEAANKLTADEVADALAKFDDADSISTYAKNVVAYSAINNILSGSTKDGKFFVGAKDTVTAARFATFMLKQMGYTVADYKAAVADLAATKGSKVSATLTGDLTRDDAVGAMYGVLTAEKVSGKTVIADIVGTDAAKKAIAEKAGLIAVEGLVKSVTAVTTTKVLVTLNKAVDAATAANFAIAGATVSAATLSNGTDVVLTTSVLTPAKEYSLTVSGLKSSAVENASVTKTFVVPEISKLYAQALTAEKTVLKADGASSTLVTFSLKDAAGNVIKDAQDVEVAFTSTFGNFGEKRVSVQNGIATVMFTSEFLTADKTADLTALVVEAKDANLIGLKATLSVILSPNPDTITETLGATLVSAESNQADRITLYFNKEVNVANYIFPSTNARKGEVDTTKALIFVAEGTLDNGTGGTPVNYRGLLPVDGNKKALQLLLDVEANTANALTDNANVTVSFNDLTGTVAIPVTKTFKLTDARKPAMLSVTNEGLRKLKVTFSEPVEYNSALTLANWSIDGTLLSDATWQGTTAVNVTVGAFDVANATDNRSVVTITLGAGKYFTTGAHSIQTANVGDWAKLSDPLNNVMNTQTLDFTIAADTSAPVATVEVQSPEQWLVTYNRDVAETAGQFQSLLKLQRLDTTTGTWVDDPLPLSVTKIDDNKFLVETCVDWTITHQTLTSLKNYFNFSYQLKIAKDAVTNVANGLKSSEQSLALGGAMLTPDTTSPVISSIEEVTAGTAYKAIMSEPVKMGVANNEGQTPAQTQANIPVVTASFIKSDFTKTIEGTVGGAFLDSYDKVLDVKPVSTLEAGNWILVIRSISDDIGNTAASVTKEFTVAGTTTNTAFKVIWAFADVDKDLAVEPTDATIRGPGGAGVVADEDQLYDYVYVKFNKAVSISGDFKNALKTANYTLDGSALPMGTQILANIAGYDELDAVIDSVTIRLPQGYLSGKNSPHVVNVSTNLESAVGEKITSAGELLLPYAVTTSDLMLQFAADLTTRTLVDNVLNAKTACTITTATGSAINVVNVPAFVAAYNAAKASIDAPVVLAGATSYVKDQYLAAINAYKASVVSLTGFTTAVVLPTGLVGAQNIDLQVLGVSSAGFKVTTSNPYVATFEAGKIVPNAAGTTVLTVTDNYWGVSKVVTVTVTGTTGNFVITSVV